MQATTSSSQAVRSKSPNPVPTAADRPPDLLTSPLMPIGPDAMNDAPLDSDECNAVVSLCQAARADLQLVEAALQDGAPSCNRLGLLVVLARATRQADDATFKLLDAHAHARRAAGGVDSDDAASGSADRAGPAAPIQRAPLDPRILRLHRIEGQVHGIERMIESERPTVDILTQFGAVRTALEALGFRVLSRYVREQVASGRTGEGDEARRRIVEAVRCLTQPE